MPTFSSPARPSTTSRAHRSAGRHLTTVLLAVIAAVAVMLVGVPAAEAMPDTGGPACVRHDTTATLTPGPASPRYRIAGWLCTPPHPTGTVQVLMSGYTYDHTYWTTPDPTADWVSAALGSGQSVYMIDRVGVGASDKPAANQVTADTEATVTHQIVTALRDGTIGDYRKVVGVGHSYGSLIWMAEAASHHDVDALVLTGMLHGLPPEQITDFANHLHPAVDDPKFANMLLPAGYLTTLPGARAGFFLDATTALPGAAAWDEASKSTGTSGELTFTPETETSYSRHIRVPVLAIVGADDALLCTADLPCGTGAQLCQRERPDYATTTPLAMASIPKTGHSITLHRTAPAAEAIANQWITRPAGRIPGVIACRG